MIVGCRSTGEISLNGSSISLLPIHKRASLGLSYLPQEASVFRKLTVEENIRAVLELQHGEDGKRLSKDAISSRAEALLDELQIAHLRENPALSLSGGERRRVEIARALATNPNFILLDEPFAGVDPIAVLEIQKIVKFLKQRNIGVLITDHNVRETLGICDHAYIISDGARRRCAERNHRKRKRTPRVPRRTLPDVTPPRGWLHPPGVAAGAPLRGHARGRAARRA